MGRIYNFAARVTIAKPVSGSFSRQQPNAIVVNDLRMQGTIEKTLGDDPNTATIIISNLAERTRAEVEEKPRWVRVDVGFDGELERVFTGDLYHAHSEKVDADWETTLELKDGLRAYRFARVNRSYSAGVDGYTAVQECAKALGFRSHEVSLTPRARAELAGQYAGGLALYGNAATQLRTTLGRFGMTYSIQDGRLQVLLADETSINEALVIDESSGLIGSPQFGSPEKAKAKPVLMFETSINPRLTPGHRVSLASKTANGIFKLERVVHQFDSRGEARTSNCEAKAA